MKRRIYLAFGGFALSLFVSMPAHGSAAMQQPMIDALARGLAECKGRVVAFGDGPKGPADVATRLPLLARPSAALKEAEAEELYQIAKGLLTPATGIPAWLPDGETSLKCPAMPKEAVALLEYLAGKGRDEWRGFVNAFGLLGLAHQTGAAGQVDHQKARLYYLRWRLHHDYLRWVAPSARPAGLPWSDGRDDDVIANVDRAGMRPYFDALVKNERYGATARLLLAERLLPSDPAKARPLFRNLEHESIARLTELEAAGTLPITGDREDIAFWAKAARERPGVSQRMMKGVLLANDGSVPTSPRRPTIEQLRPHLNAVNLHLAPETEKPVAVRALVDPSGRAIYVEPCTAKQEGVRNWGIGHGTSILRLYDVARFPKLPITMIADRPVYGWVQLPAVQFLRGADQKIGFELTNLPPEDCVHTLLPTMIVTSPSR